MVQKQMTILFTRDFKTFYFKWCIQMSLFFDFYYIFKHLMLHFNSEMLFTLNKPSFKSYQIKRASKYLVNIIFPASLVQLGLFGGHMLLGMIWHGIYSIDLSSQNSSMYFMTDVNEKVVYQQLTMPLGSRVNKYDTALSLTPPYCYWPRLYLGTRCAKQFFCTVDIIYFT